jgi:hypothetical protein
VLRRYEANNNSPARLVMQSLVGSIELMKRSFLRLFFVSSDIKPPDFMVCVTLQMVIAHYPLQYNVLTKNIEAFFMLNRAV